MRAILVLCVCLFCDSAYCGQTSYVRSKEVRVTNAPVAERVAVRKTKTVKRKVTRTSR